jgi:hypothetical protein
MKLRIQGNSLRLRLSEEEGKQFAQTGRLEAAAAFGPGESQTLHYVLVRREAIAGITADFTGHVITVYLPESAAAAWINNDEASLSGVVDNGTAQGLKILVEKDMDCRH